MVPAILGVKHLRRAPSDEGGAARADRFAIGASPHSGDVDPEQPQTIRAVAQLILLVHIAATSGTDERTASLRVINIDPVAACPALVYPDIKMTIIDHRPETTLVAQHLVPPFRWFFNIGRIQIAKPALDRSAAFHNNHILLLFV